MYVYYIYNHIPLNHILHPFYGLAIYPGSAPLRTMRKARLHLVSPCDPGGASVGFELPRHGAPGKSMEKKQRQIGARLTHGESMYNIYIYIYVTMYENIHNYICNYI